MVYSTAARAQEELHEARSTRAGRPMLVAEGKRYAIGPGGATIGRSRDCDVVVDDANVSRRHAEIRPGPHGWTVADLGSTNGTRVNGRRVDPNRPQSIKPGDVIELGTSRAIFELE